MYLPLRPAARRPRSRCSSAGTPSGIFLSADSCGTIDWFAQEVTEQMLAAGMAKDWNIRIVHQRVIPDLKEAGVTDEQLETMLVENPVRWLTGG